MGVGPRKGDSAVSESSCCCCPAKNRRRESPGVGDIAAVDDEEPPNSSDLVDASLWHARSSVSVSSSLP